MFLKCVPVWFVNVQLILNEGSIYILLRHLDTIGTLELIHHNYYFILYENVVQQTIVIFKLVKVSIPNNH